MYIYHLIILLELTIDLGINYYLLYLLNLYMWFKIVMNEVKLWLLLIMTEDNTSPTL